MYLKKFIHPIKYCPICHNKLTLYAQPTLSIFNYLNVYVQNLPARNNIFTLQPLEHKGLPFQLDLHKDTIKISPHDTTLHQMEEIYFYYLCNPSAIIAKQQNSSLEINMNQGCFLQESFFFKRKNKFLVPWYSNKTPPHWNAVLEEYYSFPNPQENNVFVIQMWRENTHTKYQLLFSPVPETIAPLKISLPETTNISELLQLPRPHLLKKLHTYVLLS